jgi:hypothetical protein
MSAIERNMMVVEKGSSTVRPEKPNAGQNRKALVHAASVPQRRFGKAAKRKIEDAPDGRLGRLVRDFRNVCPNDRSNGAHLPANDRAQTVRQTGALKLSHGLRQHRLVFERELGRIAGGVCVSRRR